MPKTFFDPSRITLHGPVMGTRWSASLDAPALQQALAAAVEQVDQQMSPWKPDSDLSRLNRAAAGQWLPMSAQILEVLARAQGICRFSDGAFDPAVGPLVDAWGFGAPRDTLDPAAILAARELSGRPIDQWLEPDAAAGRARKHAPMQIDLCGIAKGYAVDRMAAARCAATAWRMPWRLWMAGCARWAARRTDIPGRWPSKARNGAAAPCMA
jgi:thiamine biosynthesis lipoprotein